MKNTAPTYEDIIRELRKAGDRKIAEHSSRFFKTDKGEYGEGDKFLGIRVPVVRKHAKKYRGAPLSVVRKLLNSEFHEERLLAAIMLVERFKRGDAAEKRKVYELYIKSTRCINNWDIVDVSAHYIIGPYLQDRSRQILYEFASSASLWKRRIAIISTFDFIRKNDFVTTLEISERLLRDPHDLIHKAVGWMLREIGKRDMAVEEKFLTRHCEEMPRTMLRYAIEKFPEKKRQRYLQMDKLRKKA